MTLSLHQVGPAAFARGLTGLHGVLAKAAAHVEAKAIEPAALLQARLYPDMFPLIRQAQIATDFAKGATARLAGEEPPSWPDDEADFAALSARVDRARAYVTGFDPARFEDAATREITLVRRGQTSVVQGAPYLLEQALPNFWFHVTTAYAILRHNGVEVGKRDFLGAA